MENDKMRMGKGWILVVSLSCDDSSLSKKQNKTKTIKDPNQKRDEKTLLFPLPQVIFLPHACALRGGITVLIAESNKK